VKRSRLATEPHGAFPKHLLLDPAAAATTAVTEIRSSARNLAVALMLLVVMVILLDTAVLRRAEGSATKSSGVGSSGSGVAERPMARSLLDTTSSERRVLFSLSVIRLDSTYKGKQP
jgi:hypothetical protein